MCVSISCMPTFKALTQRNTYGYFFNVGHPPVTYVLSWERPNPVGKEGVEPSMFLMSRFYRPLQSPLCAFPQNLCRITTTKLLAHLSATYRLLQSRYRLIDADKVFHRYMVAMLQAVTWKTLTSLATALNSIPLWGERSVSNGKVWKTIRRWQRPKEENICETGLPGFGPGNAAVKVLCLTAWR